MIPDMHAISYAKVVLMGQLIMYFIMGYVWSQRILWALQCYHIFSTFSNTHKQSGARSTLEDDI